MTYGYNSFVALECIVIAHAQEMLIYNMIMIYQLFHFFFRFQPPSVSRILTEDMLNEESDEEDENGNIL